MWENDPESPTEKTRIYKNDTELFFPESQSRFLGAVAEYFFSIV